MNRQHWVNLFFLNGLNYGFSRDRFSTVFDFEPKVPNEILVCTFAVTDEDMQLDDKTLSNYYVKPALAALERGLKELSSDDKTYLGLKIKTEGTGIYTEVSFEVHVPAGIISRPQSV